MYKFKALALIVIFACAPTVEGNFPNDPKPCPYGDSECIKKIVDFLLSEKIDGYAPLNIISMNPLKVPSITMKQGQDSAVSIELTFKNTEITGIKNGKITKVKGFKKDLTQRHEIVLESPSVSLLSDYSINGKILILPISGSGKSNITLDNIKLKIAFQGESFVKNGATHMNVKDIKFKVDTSRLHFNFSNLFNGDKILGDNMNLFLNENWKDIFGEIQGSMGEAFASVVQSIINNVFQKYPYEKLFASV